MLPFFKNIEAFHNFSEHLNDVIFQLDEKGYILYINPAWESLTTYSTKETIGKPIHNFIQYGENESLNLLSQSSIEEFQKKVQIINKNNGAIEVELLLQVHSDESVQQRGFVGIIKNSVNQDVTAELRAQQNFQTRITDYAKRQDLLLYISLIFNKNEKLHKRISSALRIMGQFINLSAIYIYKKYEDTNTNEHYQVAYHWKIQEDDFSGSDFLSTSHHIPSMQEILLRDGLLKSNNILSITEPVRDFLIKRKLTSVFILPIFVKNEFYGFVKLDDRIKVRNWDDGELDFMQMFVLSLTNALEQDIAQQKLLQSEAQIQALLDSSVQGIVLLNQYHQIIKTNKRAQDDFLKIWKAPLQQGQDFRHKLPPENQAYFRLAFQKAMKGIPSSDIYEFQYHQESIWYEISYRPVYDENKEVLGVAFSALDISKRKKDEEELKNTLKSLRERNFELDNFVYRVSHDLRAPLSSTLGLLNLFKLDPNQASTFLEKMEAQILKLDDFINTILAYSRTLNAKERNEKIDFRELILNDFEELRYMENADNLIISIDVDETIDFYSDPFRLSIIFKNFISNAIKYQNPEADIKQLNITIETKDKQILIEFKDNGIGIDPEQLPKIFDMFHRATEYSEGSGLGLYIVKLNMEKMSGNVYVESEKGKGTSFRLILPNLRASL